MVGGGCCWLGRAAAWTIGARSVINFVSDAIDLFFIKNAVPQEFEFMGIVIFVVTAEVSCVISFGEISIMASRIPAIARTSFALAMAISFVPPGMITERVAT